MIVWADGRIFSAGVKPNAAVLILGMFLRLEGGTLAMPNFRCLNSNPDEPTRR
jgi:hypothetical protein